MKPQPGQIKDLQKLGVSILPDTTVEIIAEAGNDNGETFRGDFLCKVGSGRNSKVYKVKDNKLTTVK